MAPSSPSASSSSSSSSSSHSSGSKSQTYGSHSHTIGFAVGFGVGVPILLTVCILVWVSIRHRRKQREEDELHKDIDFNGDVSFWSPRMQESASRADGARGAQGIHRRDTIVTNHTGGDEESVANMSEMDATLRQDSENPSLSHLYTPELGFIPQGSQETFSRAVHSVYGPAPGYPSTEKLRAPSWSGSMASLSSGRIGHFRSGSFSSSIQTGGGPFATPPRNSSTPSAMSPVFPPAPAFGNSTHPYATHYRRMSDNSVVSRPPGVVEDLENNKVNVKVSTTSLHEPHTSAASYKSDDDESAPGPLGSQLNGLRESPHPYSDLAGALSRQSVYTTSSQFPPDGESDGEEDIIDPSSPLRGEAKNPTRHVYHQQARDRNSTFAFQS